MQPKSRLNNPLRRPIVLCVKARDKCIGRQLGSDVFVEIHLLFAVVFVRTTIRHLQMEAGRSFRTIGVLNLKFHVLSMVPSFDVIVEVQDLPVREIT